VVDRIPAPNTSNLVNRISNTGSQARPQTNDQGDTKSPLSNTYSSNSTSANKSLLNNPDASLRSPNEAANKTNGNIANVQSVINALRQLSSNQNLTAQVISSKALNNNEMALLQRINPSLVQQLKTTQAAQTSNQASANTNIQTGNSPLYLTKLAINATANINALIDAKTLTTITNQAFSTNQTLTLGQQNGQLQINASNKLQFNLQERLQQAASQTLKNILPRQESVSQLQQFTGQLSQIIAKLPIGLQTKLASTQVAHALNQLNRFTQTSHSLQQGRQVQRALANSGTSFEAKLTQANNLANNLNSTGVVANLSNASFNTNNNFLTSQSNLPIIPQSNLQNDIRTALDKLLTAINTSDTSTRLNSLSNPLNQTDIDKLITAIIATQSTSTAQTVNNINAPKNLSAATAAIFRLLGIQMPIETPNVAQLPKAIEQHLKKLMEQTQAKIQFNQLRSIGLDQPSSEARGTLQQFHTELPLRFNEQVLPLQLSIQEQEIVKERSQDETTDETKDNENKSKTRRWQVFLSFDLPNDEKLHSQLTIIESSISATLWAESTSLCHKAEQDISWLRDKLLANGLTVEDITCLQGRPSQKETSLDYNLVDIKT
jgi:hypothetical protein